MKRYFDPNGVQWGNLVKQSDYYFLNKKYSLVFWPWWRNLVKQSDYSNSLKTCQNLAYGLYFKIFTTVHWLWFLGGCHILWSYLKLILEMLMVTPKTPTHQIKQTLNRYSTYSWKGLTFDCIDRFSLLCTVAMVPCWLSYLMLILEMLIDYYEIFHVEIQDYQRAQTPV